MLGVGCGFLGAGFFGLGRCRGVRCGWFAFLGLLSEEITARLTLVAGSGERCRRCWASGLGARGWFRARWWFVFVMVVCEGSVEVVAVVEWIAGI